MTPRRIAVGIGLVFYCLITSLLYAQVRPVTNSTGQMQDTGKIIRILRADRLTLVKLDSSSERYILAGNVQLMQDNPLFY